MKALEYCHGFDSFDELDFAKGNGLIPAIVQHNQTGQVLMLGYMNRESLEKTISSKLVTFWSRDRKKLWTKGEESGNFLHVRSICTDCDKDTLLVLALPEGPVCHLGTVSCFDASPLPDATSRALFAQRMAREAREAVAGGK